MPASSPHAKIERLIAQESWDAAAADCIQLVKAQPQDSQGWLLLSTISSRLNQHRMAVNAALKAIDLQPSNADYLLHLAKLYVGFSAWSAARKVLDKLDIMAAQLNSAQTTTLAMLYFQGMHIEKAMMLYQAVLISEPDNADVKFNLAALLRFTGGLEQGAALLNEVIAARPDDVDACCALAHIQKHTRTHHILTCLDKCIAQRAPNDNELAGQELASLHYAKGKVLEDGGQFTQAFASFEAGASYKKALQTFTVEQEIARIRAMQTLVSGNALPVAHSQDATGPIFIVGMPRTGTTLVERLLSAHSQVTSGGELNFLPMALLEACGSSWFSGPEGITAEVVHTLTDVSMKAVGERYQALSRDLLACDGVFTDKLPLNALFVPVILSAIPNARVIHVERNAMDTAFSNFKMLFNRGYHYSYSLEDIAAYLPAYQQMMQQWQHTYNEKILTVAYETLTANPEDITRDILQFCGLDWEASCLQFHAHTGAIQTASASQVKEPLHNRYVGQWRNYEDSLLVIKQKLQEQGLTPLTEEDIK